MEKWYKIISVNDIPKMGSRVVVIEDTEIAIFKTQDERIFAVNNTCPHKQGKLAEGLVHEHIVTCPLHNWNIDLKSGEALGNDTGCTNIYNSKINEGIIFIQY